MSRRSLQPARWIRTLRHGIRSIDGVSAVEFALLAPIFGLLIAATVDLGGMLSTRFVLDSVVSAGANYALVNAAKVTPTNAAGVASAIGAIAASSSNAASGTVVVNNGPTATVANGAVTSSGSASNAGLCYCPTISSSTINWGSSASCGSTCASGGLAGKFVLVKMQQTYTPLLINYGMTQSGAITVQTVVQVQ